jgi:signal-transduction protein with cAMP-binding, CBS, and nucleotidyltransferase domain
MNEVAEWAKERGLMDHTGEDCVPRQVSLLEAHVHQPARVALLQRRDGFAPDLDVAAEVPPVYQADVAGLLAGAPLFAVLDQTDLRALADAARPMTLGPTERFLVQGQAASSLFVVAEGEVEVLLRGEDGDDVRVETLERGAVVVDALVSGSAACTATMRAVDAAVVYEIGRRQLDGCIRRRPEWAEHVAAAAASQLRARRSPLDAHGSDFGAILRRVRSALGAD